MIITRNKWALHTFPAHTYFCDMYRSIVPHLTTAQIAIHTNGKMIQDTQCNALTNHKPITIKLPKSL